MLSLSTFELQTVRVERPRYTRDASGGGVQQFFEVSPEPIPCSIQPCGGGSPYFFGQRQTTNTHHVYFDEDPQLQRGDRLKDQDGVYYIVNNFENIAGRSEIWVAEVGQQNTSTSV